MCCMLHFVFPWVNPTLPVSPSESPPFKRIVDICHRSSSCRHSDEKSQLEPIGAETHPVWAHCPVRIPVCHVLCLDFWTSSQLVVTIWTHQSDRWYLGNLRYGWKQVWLDKIWISKPSQRLWRSLPRFLKICALAIEAIILHCTVCVQTTARARCPMRNCLWRKWGAIIISLKASKTLVSEASQFPFVAWEALINKAWVGICCMQVNSPCGERKRHWNSIFEPSGVLMKTESRNVS